MAKVSGRPVFFRYFFGLIFGACICSGGIALFYSFSFAQEERPQLDNYSFSRSIILGTVGYAVIFGELSKDEGRMKALDKAKRSLLAKGKATIVDTLFKAGIKKEACEIQFPTVEDIAILYEKEVTPPISGNGKSYAVRIVGEIRYKLETEPGADFSDLAKEPDMPLTIKVWATKENYRAGEQMSFFLTGNRNFYAVLVDIAPDGSMVQLLPNGYRKDTFFAEGKTYKLPDFDAGDEFTLEVAPPFGEERVLLFASDEPLVNLTNLSNFDNGTTFNEISGTSGDFRSHLLEGKSVNLQLNNLKPQQQEGKDYFSFFEGQLLLKTAPIE